MKILIMTIFTLNLLFAGLYDKFAKQSLKYVKPNVIESIGKKYGDDGVKALENLTIKYGNKSLQRFNSISSEFGINGIKIVAKYGDDILLNKSSINLLSKYQDKGYYMLKQYPNSIKYYEKYSDDFMKASDNFGNQRVMKYLDDSSKYGQDGKVLNLLNRFGDKANKFFQENWGKLLTGGFVLLNSDEIISSIENVGKESVKVAGDTVSKIVNIISNSTLGLFIGLAFFLWIFLKFGWNKVFKKRIIENDINKK
ncbi:hypothetical protein [Aliarcobacter butzleri]|uniref:hypothetical protein n=1 Tax=Aliarcobacter butzleri TaxID=28197 RepID=UPI0024DEB7A0|nr:hypothetical protein [Aliarcobacter butzleri]MDK2080132.1 hypothetical protein [Aliarcobacter butzleri]